jgi:hypothetical protein
LAESLRIGQRKGSRLEPRTKWSQPEVIPEKAKNLLEEGMFALFFGDGGTPFLLGVLAKMGGWTWFFCGEVVVDWW